MVKPLRFACTAKTSNCRAEHRTDSITYTYGILILYDDGTHMQLPVLMMVFIFFRHYWAIFFAFELKSRWKRVKVAGNKTQGIDKLPVFILIYSLITHMHTLHVKMSPSGERKSQ